MLDDVERRRFLVQPAREHPAPVPVGPLDVDLDEGAGQLLGFPRGGHFARPQAHDHVLPFDRLARVQGDVLDDPVALVEDAEDRDPLRHRSEPRLVDARRCGGIGDHRRRRVLLAPLPAARGEHERNGRCSRETHAYSGIQGW
jgi:hypothetical protein